MLSGILLKSMSILLVLMQRKGVWNIKWKTADFEVFSDILFEKNQNSMGFMS